MLFLNVSMVFFRTDLCYSSPMKSRVTPPEMDEPPPFWKSWNRIYVAVVVYTCALVLILYWATVALNR